MDAYEATRLVFSRIQSLDLENAAKIMGYLLIQDDGEKEMIRLAFGPEALLQSVVVKARAELGLPPPSAAPRKASPFPSLPSRSYSSRLLGGAGALGACSPTSWVPPAVFSRTSNNVGGSVDDLQSSDELVSPSKLVPSPFFGGVDPVDEMQEQDQLSFLSDGAAVPANGLHVGQKRDLFYQDTEGNCRSPNSCGESALSQYSIGWGATAGHHRRACSAADIYLGSDASGVGWKPPCLYFARGYCKNGSSCRFFHGIPDDTAVGGGGGSKMDSAMEQQCQDFLLQTKSPRQLTASAFPYSFTGSVPPSPSASCKSMNFLLQQQNESQRTVSSAALMLGGDESHKFLGRPWMLDSSDFAAAMGNPFSRQIYLTFPADSTFREEDVSSYFSIYGPVQDVRIPFQQKRMFGFVTFFYAETVRLILAKGNPHFVCNSRVLVKPYKEKGKIPKKQQQSQAERSDYSVCTTPSTPLDSRNPFDFPQLGSRTFYNASITQEALLKRKLEEQQQQAAELEKAIELHSRRFMSLQLLDLKSRSHFSPITNPSTIPIQSDGGSSAPQEESTRQDENLNLVPAAAEPSQKLPQQAAVNTAVPASKVESSAGEPISEEDFALQQSVEHILPDSPFASPTRAAVPAGEEENQAEAAFHCGNGSHSHSNSSLISSTLFPAAATLDNPSFNACFFQLPRRSSDHGAVGM